MKRNEEVTKLDRAYGVLGEAYAELVELRSSSISDDVVALEKALLPLLIKAGDIRNDLYEEDDGIVFSDEVGYAKEYNDEEGSGVVFFSNPE